MSEENEVKSAITALGKTFEEFKQANDAALAELKKGQVDVVTTDKLDRLNKALDDAEAAKSAIEKRVDEVEARVNRASLSGQGKGSDLEAETKSFNALRRDYKTQAEGDVSAEDYAAYKSGFLNVMRKGEKSLISDAERKTMSVGSDPDGGYVVPASISARIVTRAFETSPIRPMVTVETIGTDALEGLRDTDEAAASGWVSEEGTRSATSTTPQLGKWRIPVHEMYTMPAATQQLLDDANVDIEAWLGRKIADKMVRVENAAFITGNGIGKPQGFCSYTTAATADSSRSWGVLEHIATGVSGDFPASNPADKFFDIEAAMKPAYLGNASWATRRTVIQKIRKIKDGNGQYLWQPGLVLGKPSAIIGYPVVMLEDMPALGADSLSLAFGDFREAYTIVDRQGFRVIRDNLTSKPYVQFYTTRRVGGGVLQFEALKFLKFGTS